MGRGERHVEEEWLFTHRLRDKLLGLAANFRRVIEVGIFRLDGLVLVGQRVRVVETPGTLDRSEEAVESALLRPIALVDVGDF